MDLALRLQPDPARLTLPRFLADVVGRHADRVALRFEGRDLSYEALAREARRLARGLLASGVHKGSRVALLAGNDPDWVVCAFAVALAGGVLVPVNTFATPEERDYILRHSDASLLLFRRRLLTRSFLDELLERHPALAAAPHADAALFLETLPRLRRVVALDGEAPQGGVGTLEALRAAADGVPEALLEAVSADVHPTDDGLVVYTSGTTAHPKGILHAQRAPVIQSWRFAELMGLEPEDRVFSAQPFFWTAGLAMSLGATLAAGATLILQETFEPGEALELVERERASVIHAFPHQEKAMGDHPGAASRDLSGVRKTRFGSPLARIAGLEKDAWGMDASYGLSETFTLASALPADAPAELRKRSSGLPLAGNTLRIVDPESGAPLPAGTHGEIAVKGPTLMKGYLKVESERVFDAEGFFHSQDGGSLDPEGHLHWTGRLSNLIKTGGANVSPLEIEAAANGIEGLRAGLAVGVAHPTLGEAIVLCAVVGEGEPPSEEAVRSQLRERLAAYKVPRRVLFFRPEELSYTGNQKIELAPLREAALRRLGEEGAEIDGHSYTRS